MNSNKNTINEVIKSKNKEKISHNCRIIKWHVTIHINRLLIGTYTCDKNNNFEKITILKRYTHIHNHISTIEKRKTMCRVYKLTIYLRLTENSVSLWGEGRRI